MAHERALSEDLIESEENFIASWKKGSACSEVMESLAILSPIYAEAWMI